MILEDITGIDLRKSDNPMKDLGLYATNLVIIARIFNCDKIEVNIIYPHPAEYIKIEYKLEDFK